MYISKVSIKNYRCWRETSIDFVPGVNVIIGENNSGKTALLRALGLIFSGSSRPRMQVFDFNQSIDDFTQPPTITVTATIRSDGEGADRVEDKALVASWLVKLASPWEAQLTYRFALPDEDVPAFKAQVGDSTSTDKFWKTVERFLPKYVSRIYGGKPDAQIRAEPEHLAKFSYQFVDAIRDAASQLFAGNNPLLRSMLEQVLDHDIDNDDKMDKEAKDQATAERRVAFRSRSEELIGALKQRVNLAALTTLIKDTGAEDGGTPKLSGALDETDIISALKLFIERSGLALPATFNGLGYNNLVYISLLLASMDFDSDFNRHGQNTLVFPMLVLEEPEAHLHPALQYKLLRFIRERRVSRSRQVFLTTHSTHVTVAAGLDSIVCMSAPTKKEDPRVSYPGKVFADTQQGQTSKKYVERFLDATKSAMLFAKAIILVEGLAEQLLIPCLAEYVELPLETKHVALIPVGGLTFKHFLPLFGVGCGDDRATFALDRRVACIVDGDPMRKKKGHKKTRWEKCWPYELDQDAESYEYRAYSVVVDGLRKLCNGHNDRIVVKYATKTFEYDLAFQNADSGIVECGTPEGDEIAQEVPASLGDITNPDDKHKAEVATRYLLAVEGAKGAHAFDPARQLRDDLAQMQKELEEAMAKTDKADEEKRSRLVKAAKDKKAAVVPAYINQAIRWVSGQDEEGVVA